MWYFILNLHVEIMVGGEAGEVVSNQDAPVEIVVPSEGSLVVPGLQICEFIEFPRGDEGILPEVGFQVENAEDRLAFHGGGVCIIGKDPADGTPGIVGSPIDADVAVSVVAPEGAGARCRNEVVADVVEGFLTGHI
jgi:hypothetical protein